MMEKFPPSLGVDIDSFEFEGMEMNVTLLGKDDGMEIRDYVLNNNILTPVVDGVSYHIDTDNNYDLLAASSIILCDRPNEDDAPTMVPHHMMRPTGKRKGKRKRPRSRQRPRSF